MNMKKSIAGVMAGAMAVSAMAAAVSADQEAISLSYDLKTYVKDNGVSAAKVQLVASYEGALVTADSMKAGEITFNADNGFITGSTVLNGKGYQIWSGSGVASMSAFEFNARPYKDIVNDLEEAPQPYKASGNPKALDGSVYTQKLDDPTSGYIDTKLNKYAMPITITGEKEKFDLAKYDIISLGYSKADNLKAIGYTMDDIDTASKYYYNGKVYGLRNATAKMTYKLPAVVEVNAANGWTFSTTTSEDIAVKFFDKTLMVEKTMDADLFTCGFFTKDSNGNVTKKSMIADSKSLGQPATLAIASFTGGETGDIIYPFKTTLNPKTKSNNYKLESYYVNKTGNNENDVIAALTSRKLGGNYYTKPVAVINDAIANHTNVTFTFYSYDQYVGTAKSHLLNEWVDIDRGYTYDTSGTLGFDWHNPTFGQHLYAPSYNNGKDHYSLFGTDDFDNYGSKSSAWGINLFTGAVVVNNNLTMQLSDTAVFEWGSNSLTFDWFDITETGAVTDAKTFLTSMLLYTPVDWYWDRLDVVVTDEEREDIDAGAGLEEETEVLDDEEPEIEAPEIEEPEVEETEAETETKPVEPAGSPATGNAPVALAVIPVALAAAAVVAKKRG